MQGKDIRQDVLFLLALPGGPPRRGGRFRPPEAEILPFSLFTTGEMCGMLASHANVRGSRRLRFLAPPAGGAAARGNIFERWKHTMLRKEQKTEIIDAIASFPSNNCVLEN